MPHGKSLYFGFLIVTACGLASVPAAAQLGARAVPASGSGAVMHRAQNGQVSYLETIDDVGITVRQYVDSSGVVYAVSWNGPAMPRLSTLLGTYLAQFDAGARAQPPGALGLHALRVEEAGLVVESAVRLRTFSGRAWLSNALPAGVVSRDIAAEAP